MSIRKVLTVSILTFNLLAGAVKYDDNSEEERSKGELATLNRLSAGRAYADSKLGGFRYYGTGSKSGNSFAPTSIHKQASDNTNYFVTTKGNKVKDLETAGSGMSGNSENNYIQVYDPPTPAQNYMMAAGGNAMQNLLGMDEQAFGEMVAETGHGGGYGGGHGGGGKGCNSALGLLGVLGLAAYLQNVLRNMNMMDNNNGGARRGKRSVHFEEIDGMENLEQFLFPANESEIKFDEKTHKKVMEEVIPLLSAVAHARDGLIPIHCTHSSVCLISQILAKELGPVGHSVGIRISSAIAKHLAKLTRDERAEQIRMITKAGKMGRNGRNCLKVFPTCNRLRRLPTYNIPF